MRRVAFVLLLVACGDDQPVDRAMTDSVSDTSSSDADAVDEPGDVEVEVAPEALAASDYCESIATSFCDYYVRCARMAVPDVAACRPVFLETCNARYEPLWSALADDGRLSLSRAGIDHCADYLAGVSCEQQQNDLDWECAGVWRGAVAAGGACGPGLESFVCAEGTTCVIDLDFCGVCTPLAPPGATCDLTQRCAPTASCVDGACVDRTRVGAVCSANDVVGCVLGAGCVDGTCRASSVVALGETCDQTHRCPYKSVCKGTCMETALDGGSCTTSSDCASGWCDQGSCVPLRAEGAACASAAACTSGRCDPDDHTCASIAFGCAP